MTVIVWDGKVLAADSRCSDTHLMHVTNVRKIFKLKNGALLGTAGDNDDRDVRAILATASPRKMPPRDKLAATKTAFSGIMIFPKGHVFVIDIDWEEHESEGEWRASVDAISEKFVAVGHGSQFAYGALEHGASAAEAVRAACKRDLTCALPVQQGSFEVPPAPEIPPVPLAKPKPKRAKK
jgi:hypothetical protein